MQTFTQHVMHSDRNNMWVYVRATMRVVLSRGALVNK